MMIIRGCHQLSQTTISMINIVKAANYEAGMG